MKRVLGLLTAMDFLVALGCIAWGVFSRNWWLLAGGVFGLGVASLRPAQRVHSRLESFVARRKPKPRNDVEAVERSEAFYRQPSLPVGARGGARFKVVVDPRPGNHLDASSLDPVSAQDAKRQTYF